MGLHLFLPFINDAYYYNTNSNDSNMVPIIWRSAQYKGGIMGSKKNEADNNPDLMAAALTFDELNYWIKEEFIDIENIENDESCQNCNWDPVAD